jgi:hypothetical protein
VRSAETAEPEMSHKSALSALPAKFPANFADDDEYADLIEPDAPRLVLRWAMQDGWVGYENFRRRRQIAAEKPNADDRTVAA